MKFIIALIFSISLYSNHTISVFSQGFDWTYSWRLPSESPTLFIGPLGSTGVNIDNAGYSTFDSELNCCKYDNGQGRNSSIGILVEQWYKGIYSFQGIIQYNAGTSQFTSQVRNLIFSESKEETLIRDYTLQTKWNYIDLALIAKSRVAGSHVSITGGFLLNMPIGIELNHRVDFYVEKYPTDKYTSESTPTQVENAGFVLSPLLGIEYDLAMMNGMYSKVFFRTSYTALSRVTIGDPWRAVSFQLGAALCMDKSSFGF